MSPIKIWFSALLVTAFSHVLAGQAINDLGIGVTVQPQGVTPPGTEGTVAITITNDGPNIASVATFRWLATNDGSGLSYPPLGFPGPFDGPCRFSIGLPPPGDFFGTWVIRDISPGESRTCTFGFRVLETTKTSQIARWEVNEFEADDPNPTNNEAEVLLRFAGNSDPVSVPALSVTGFLVLVFMVGWLAYRMRHWTLKNL